MSELQTRRETARAGPRIKPEAWLEEASTLEDQLLQQARRTPDGDVVWLQARSPQEGESRPVRIGPHLYNGVTGAALFLAAMEHVEQRDGRRDCILSALAPLRRQLAELASSLAAGRDQIHRLGGFTGLGGYIYGFALIGRWLGELELIAEAAGIATLITPEQIAADNALDVMNGCAGAALALLALDRISPDPLGGKAPVERAIACGEHLLTRRTVTAAGIKAWPANGKPPLCGFAHGAAGIACCLARLFQRTGDRRFREAAEEGASFEHLQYDPEHGNWPILGLSELHFMGGWCNGASGIALGRLAMLELGGAGHIHEDLQAALRVTQAPASRMGDFLCCGYMGKAEVLLHASKVLGDERLRQAAEEIACQVVARNHGQDGLVPGSGRFTPDFFKGPAGMAYTFLRLARPSLLPCVLSMEAEA